MRIRKSLKNVHTLIILILEKYTNAKKEKEKIKTRLSSSWNLEYWKKELTTNTKGVVNYTYITDYNTCIIIDVSTNYVIIPKINTYENILEAIMQ